MNIRGILLFITFDTLATSINIMDKKRVVITTTLFLLLGGENYEDIFSQQQHELAFQFQFSYL